MSKKILLFLTALLTFACVSAHSFKSYTGKVKDGYNFWLSTPKTDGAEKKPLVIFLHGASLQGNNLQKVLRYGTLDAISKGLDIDAYVIAPQTVGAWQPSKVMNSVDYILTSHGDIDTNRIYVIGMSLGGYGTINVAATYPDRIAAAMAICGGGSVKNLSNLNQLPLWIIHGTADRAVSIKESDRVVNMMKQADAKTSRLIYTRVPGMNHSEPARLLYMPAVYEWLLSHSLTDDKREVSKGFDVNNSTLRGAYRSIKSKRVTVESATKSTSKLHL